MVKFDNDWFMNRIKEKRPNDYKEYKFLEEYKNAKTKIRTIHLVCGNEISILPNTFISRGDGCPICATKKVHDKQRKTQKQFEKEIPPGIILLEPYKGAFEKIKVHCFFCDKTYTITARELIREDCTRCRGHYNRTIQEVRDEIRIETKGEYKMVSESYKNPHTPITIHHKECNKDYMVTMHNFRKGRRCPYCKSSVGEVLVTNVLESNNINFEPQKTFDDLKLKSKLSYDFYLPDYNLLIEYQGEQHYKPIKHFGGEETFKIQKQIDNIKREYAKNNGYKLLEIPYTYRKYKDVRKIIIKEIYYS